MMRPRACRSLCGMMAVLFVSLLLPGPPGLAMAEERGPVELLKDRHDTVLAIVEQDPDVGTLCRRLLADVLERDELEGRVGKEAGQRGR